MSQGGSDEKCLDPGHAIKAPSKDFLAARVKSWERLQTPSPNTCTMWTSATRALLSVFLTGLQIIINQSVWSSL